MKITIVIPCRNERPFIKECIDAIYNCTLPEGYHLQIFVVDGMSNDGTRDVVGELCKQRSNLFLIDNTKQLTPFAFNLGIFAGAEADFIQIVGARHILSSNYLQSCIEKLLSHPEIWGVGGQIKNVAINPLSERISAVMSSRFGVGMGNFRTMTSSGYTDTVTSPMYPARVFREIGYFDEMLVRNQDDDFNFRISNAGGKLYLIHDIHLKYYVRATIKGLRKQYFQYGYWKVFVNQKHGKMTTLRQLFPPVFVFYLCSFLFLPLLPQWLQLIYLSPFAIYLLMSIYLGAQLSRSMKFMATSVLFPLLHLSYGMGYILGIFDFLILGKTPSDKQKELSR